MSRIDIRIEKFVGNLNFLNLDCLASLSIQHADDAESDAGDSEAKKKVRHDHQE